YVNGVEELPLETLIAENGIKIHTNTKETADKNIPWGMRCSETPLGLKVNRVNRDSAAAKAGISAYDIIVAIDGIKADAKQLATLNTATRPVQCHLFRRDELMVVEVVPRADLVDNNTYDDNQKVFPHNISLRLARASIDCEDEVDSVGYANTEDTWLNALARYQSE